MKYLTMNVNSLYLFMYKTIFLFLSASISITISFVLWKINTKNGN